LFVADGFRPIAALR
jgi:predicted transcriptional regulator